MKTLAFSNALKCGRIREVKPGELFATWRFFLPSYKVGDLIGIKDKRYPFKIRTLFEGVKVEVGSQIIYLAYVRYIRGMFLYEVTKEDVALDLMPEKSVEEFQAEILQMYSGRTVDHYGIQTVLERAADEVVA